MSSYWWGGWGNLGRGRPVVFALGKLLSLCPMVLRVDLGGLSMVLRVWIRLALALSVEELATSMGAVEST